LKRRSDDKENREDELGEHDLEHQIEKRAGGKRKRG